jgi:hypothetical protein
VCLKTGRGLWDRLPEVAKDASTLPNPAFQTNLKPQLIKTSKKMCGGGNFQQIP